MPSQPSIDEDEYQRLLRELPNDYDINYTYVAPAKSDVRPPDTIDGAAPVADTKISRDGARRMRIGGGTVLGLGLTTFTLSVGVGLGIDENEGVAAALGGGVAGGVLTIIGASLLGAGRKAARAHGDLPPRKSKAPLTSQQKSRLVLTASVGWVFGVVGIASGAGIASSDSGKVGTAATLIAVGVVSLGLGLYATIRLRADKLRRTTYLQPSPMFVRSGGGLGARLSF